jgi:hypothetical protein
VCCVVLYCYADVSRLFVWEISGRRVSREETRAEVPGGGASFELGLFASSGYQPVM